MPTSEQDIKKIEKSFDTIQYSLGIFARTGIIDGIKNGDTQKLIDCIYHLRKSIIGLYDIVRKQYPEIHTHFISESLR